MDNLLIIYFVNGINPHFFYIYINRYFVGILLNSQYCNIRTRAILRLRSLSIKTI